MHRFVVRVHHPDNTSSCTWAEVDKIYWDTISCGRYDPDTEINFDGFCRGDFEKKVNEFGFDALKIPVGVSNDYLVGYMDALLKFCLNQFGISNSEVHQEGPLYESKVQGRP